MLEAEFDGVQPLAFQAEFLRQHGIGTIGQVADTGMLGGGEVDADLVSASGLEMDLDERGTAVGFDHFIVGDRVLAFGAHGVEPVVLRVPGDRSVDGAEHGIGQTLHDRVVGLLDRALFEGAFEHAVGVFALRHDHESGGADVESLHDALTFGRTRGRDAEARCCEPADDRASGPTESRVGRHADGLVDDDEGILVVDDAHSRHGVGHDLERLPGFRHHDVEPFAGDDAIGFDDRAPRHLHSPVCADIGGRSAGEAEQLRHRGVDALAVESLGDEDGAFSHESPLSHGWSRSRRCRCL